jgi:uncharacterized protein (TIGR02444 family)
MAKAEDEDFALWTFSLDRYGRHGVAETCLWMQQRLGVDVNIVLASLYADTQGKRLPKAVLRLISEEGPGEWHREVVVPLRLARTFLKSQLHGEDAGSIAAFRTRVKQLELDAEKLEQRLIEQYLDNVATEPDQAHTAPAAIALENLRDYLSVVGAEYEGEVAERAKRLVEACIP